MKLITAAALLAASLICGNPLAGAARFLLEQYRQWRLKRAFRRLARELARRLCEDGDTGEQKAVRYDAYETFEQAEQRGWACTADWNWDGAGLSSFELEQQDRAEQAQFYQAVASALVAEAERLAAQLDGPDDNGSGDLLEV